jgi:hypothetical protein
MMNLPPKSILVNPFGPLGVFLKGIVITLQLRQSAHDLFGQNSIFHITVVPVFPIDIRLPLVVYTHMLV